MSADFEKINKKCKIEYGVNLTSNTFYYTLVSHKKIQIIPFYHKSHAKKLIKIFERVLFSFLGIVETY